MLTDEEVDILYGQYLLGCSSSEALINTIWLNITQFFGLRGCQDHRDMSWGDVEQDGDWPRAFAPDIFSLVVLHWPFDSAYNAKYCSLEDTACTWKHYINCLVAPPPTLHMTNHRHRSRCKCFKSRVPYSPTSIPYFNIYDGNNTTFLVPSSL